MKLGYSACVLRHIYRTTCVRSRSTKIPETCSWKPVDQSSLPKVPDVDHTMIAHLERLSLVEFNNEAGVERLKQAIQYANQLYMVNTDDVKPMDSVLEDRELYLRNDEMTEGNCKDDILMNAALVEEDYFVAPPGNVPLNTKKPG